MLLPSWMFFETRNTCFSLLFQSSFLVKAFTFITRLKWPSVTVFWRIKIAYPFTKFCITDAVQNMKQTYSLWEVEQVRLFQIIGP